MFGSLKEELNKISLFNEEDELERMNTGTLPNDDASTDDDIAGGSELNMEDEEELQDDIVDEIEGDELDDDFDEEDEEFLDEMLEMMLEGEDCEDYCDEIPTSRSPFGPRKDFIDVGNNNISRFQKVFLDKSCRECGDDGAYGSDEEIDDDLFYGNSKCTPINSDERKKALMKQAMMGIGLNPYKFNYGMDDFNSDDELEDEEFDTIGNEDPETSLDESILEFLAEYSDLL